MKGELKKTFDVAMSSIFASIHYHNHISKSLKEEIQFFIVTSRDHLTVSSSFSSLIDLLSVNLESHYDYENFYLIGQLLMDYKIQSFEIIGI